MILLKILVFLLRMIGVLLLILLAALCLPVYLGVLYDENVTVDIRYLLFLHYTIDGAQVTADEDETQKEEKPPSLLKKLLTLLLGGIVWLMETVGKGVKALLSLLRRGIAFLREKYRQRFPKKPKKKKTSDEEDEDETPQQKKKQSLFGSLREQRGFWGAVKFFADLGRLLGGGMVRIYRGVAVERFTLRAAICGEDAADTAIKYGEVCCFAFPALSFLLTHARRYRQDIEIIPNFAGNGNKLSFDGVFTLYPILILAHLLGALLRFAFLQIKITIRIRQAKRKAE